MVKLNLTTLLSAAAVLYVLYTSWSLVEVFFPKQCSTSSDDCIEPLWSPSDQIEITLEYVNPDPGQNRLIFYESFTINEAKLINLSVTPPARLYANQSVSARMSLSYKPVGRFRTHQVELVSFREPVRTAFKLLSGEDTGKNTSEPASATTDDITPVAFWLSTLQVYALDQSIAFERKDFPVELSSPVGVFLQKSKGANGYAYAPMIHAEPKMQASNDWVQVDTKSQNASINFAISFQNIGVGAFRMRRTLLLTMQHLSSFGFREKDIAEVRSLLVDTNIYLLITTIFVSVFHMLFDFLAFKNDITFYRKMENTRGLSMRTLVWSFVSSLIIFLYLREERASILIVLPMGISVCIELWKLARMSKISISLRSGIQWGSKSTDEQETDDLDAKYMKWLIVFMIPLCLAGAVYSLLYAPHRSWYSWCLKTLVNGVYAFGFLLMTPQLFINYRLKSVAHLPWKALSYKAFNTFIDDFFAFIVSMPTSHRIACLRDDVVFVIFLYQKWLYPVDKSRVNEFGQSGIPVDDASPSGDLENKEKVE